MSVERIVELRRRVNDKIEYGAKCNRDVNELAVLEDAMRSPLERAVRKFGFVVLIIAACGLTYALPIVAAVNFFVGG